MQRKCGVGQVNGRRGSSLAPGCPMDRPERKADPYYLEGDDWARSVMVSVYAEPDRADKIGNVVGSPVPRPFMR